MFKTAREDKRTFFVNDVTGDGKGTVDHAVHVSFKIESTSHLGADLVMSCLSGALAEIPGKIKATTVLPADPVKLAKPAGAK